MNETYDKPMDYNKIQHGEGVKIIIIAAHRAFSLKYNNAAPNADPIDDLKDY